MGKRQTVRGKKKKFHLRGGVITIDCAFFVPKKKKKGGKKLLRGQTWRAGGETKAESFKRRRRNREGVDFQKEMCEENTR